MVNSLINNCISWIIAFLFIAGNAMIAQDYSAEEYVFANGGGAVESGQFIIDGTIGQAVIGELENAGNQAQVGYWYSISGINSAEEDMGMPKGLSVEVYPNPFTDNIKFKLSPKRPGDLITIELIDFFGKKVADIKLQRLFESSEITIHNLGDLVQGVYFCRFSSGHETVVNKVIKISQ